MSENQSNRQDSNIPLLSTLKKRSKRSSSMFSFRPTRSMSTSKSLRKPKPSAVIGKAEMFEEANSMLSEKKEEN